MNERRPLLVYDGACGFCRFWAIRWQRFTRGAIDIAPYQDVAGDIPALPTEAFQSAVQLVRADGSITSGAAAAFEAIAGGPGGRLPAAIYARSSAFRTISERVYRWVADHRTVLSRLTFAMFGRDLEPPTYRHVRWLFLRVVAVIYAIAFASLLAQIPGLIGTDGILPADDLLEAARVQLGSRRFAELPTLAWLGDLIPGGNDAISERSGAAGAAGAAGTIDAMLTAMAAGGIVVAVLALFRLAPIICFGLLYVLYLSLVTVGRHFLWFQWDSLLLEVGFLAVLAAPVALRRSPSDDGPSPIAVWLYRLLLLKLMFLSGVVKLASGDVAWHELTALAIHYQTQPIPTPVAWYVHQLPAWLHTASTVVMFGIELVVPFFVLAPRRLRRLAFLPLVALQVVILVTGNYTFFNWLTIALCLWLLDDAALPAWLTREARVGRDAWVTRDAGVVRDAGGMRDAGVTRDAGGMRDAGVTRDAGGMRDAGVRGAAWLGRAARVTLAIVLAGLSLVQICQPLGIEPPWTRAAQRIFRAVGPFHVCNAYGLFAVMSTRRPEIVIEGSNDGRDWQAYTFHYKPGALDRPPPWVAPHQPRLDWQMWFAALGTYERNPWFARFCARILEGSEPVLDLLEHNPFPDAPPRQLRAVLYDYRFTDREERASTGNWWRRERIGIYAGPLSLDRRRTL